MVRLFARFIIVWCFMPLALKAVVELQPHRAYYTVTMSGRPDPRGSVSDVRGTMMLEFNKVPGGWTVQQLSELWRYQDNGSVEHIRWGYVTWETDDGSFFKFNTFRKIDDELVEDIRGTAKRMGSLTQVTYQKPEKRTVQLPEGVLFPVQHTKGLLEAAHLGEHIFPRIVFDGSSGEGASEINTFMGAKKVVAGNPTVEDAHQFANLPFWPVRFAVYGLGETAYEPLYTTTQELLPNGIIKQYVIDNEGVKVRGILERIELLPRGTS
ncbi:MAG: DUF1849 family protein [Alphaproteobacteria bacterium]|nr:DUF1849 family protein [Alphaproteobacteria bacterium]